MSERKVDRVGMRFGAGLSAILLVLAFAADLQVMVPIIGVALGIGAAFGPSNSPLSMIYKGLKSSILRSVPADPEPEAPPRFAQLIGALVLAAATIALYVFEAEALGWGLALVVAVLQALLASTGICVGCEMYLLAKRLQTPKPHRGSA